MNIKYALDALVVVGPFIVLTLFIFGSGFAMGVLWAQVKTSDLYGDIALALGTTRTHVAKAMCSRFAK